MLQEINKYDAIEFIQKYHYSKVMPRINKHFLAWKKDYKIQGIITLGWGTQPLQTIKKLFPHLITEDYYEIGKMCFHPDLNENKATGSQIISQLVNWMKLYTDKKLLYTLADGIVGKVGYVYQASNFLYGGHYWTDIYMSDEGEKIHPRSAKELLKENAIFEGKKKVFWLTHDFCEERGIKRIRGKMFRYMMPMNKKVRKMLLQSGWSLDYPKDYDLQWKMRIGKGKYEYIDMPKFSLDIVNYNRKNVYAHKIPQKSTSYNNFFI